MMSRRTGITLLPTRVTCINLKHQILENILFKKGRLRDAVAFFSAFIWPLSFFAVSLHAVWY